MRGGVDQIKLIDDFHILDKTKEHLSKKNGNFLISIKFLIFSACLHKCAMKPTQGVFLIQVFIYFRI